MRNNKRPIYKVMAERRLFCELRKGEFICTANLCCIGDGSYICNRWDNCNRLYFYKKLWGRESAGKGRGDGTGCCLTEKEIMDSLTIKPKTIWRRIWSWLRKIWDR